MSNLILITESFPLGSFTESVFIQPELKALRAVFSRVIIVPVIDRGESVPLPDGVEVSRCVVDSIFSRCKIFRLIRAYRAKLSWIVQSPAYALAAASVAAELEKMVRRLNLDPSQTIAYSFWFDFGASALAMLSRRTGINFVSRAHGYDIIISKASKLRQYTLEQSSGVWVASAAGARELSQRFPSMAVKISIGYLGVEIPSKSAVPPVTGKRLSVVSCSRVTSSKRVPLNIEFMRALAVARPDWEFKLTHIGGTPEEVNRLAAIAAAPDPVFGSQSNLTVDFTGYISNSEVRSILASGGFDWFLSLSEREGGVPMALAEAMSFGIPAIATDVGGVAEALTDDCGILLPRDVTAQEFVMSMAPYLDCEERRRRCAEESRRIMQSSFDSRKIRSEWALRLVSLLPAGK